MSGPDLDLTIVGGSFAGLSCAAAAASRGVRVAVADYLLDGGAAPATLLRGAMPRFVVKRVLRQVADFPIPNRLIDAAVSNPLVRAMAQTVFFHHRGLWSTDAWRDMARTLLDPDRASSL